MTIDTDRPIAERTNNLKLVFPDLQDSVWIPVFIEASSPSGLVAFER